MTLWLSSEDGTRLAPDRALAGRGAPRARPAADPGRRIRVVPRADAAARGRPRAAGRRTAAGGRRRARGLRGRRREVSPVRPDPHGAAVPRSSQLRLPAARSRLVRKDRARPAAPRAGPRERPRAQEGRGAPGDARARRGGRRAGAGPRRVLRGRPRAPGQPHRRAKLLHRALRRGREAAELSLLRGRVRPDARRPNRSAGA